MPTEKNQANDKRKARMKASYAASVQRHERNRQMNERQHVTNVRFVEDATYTEIAAVDTHYTDPTRKDTYGRAKRPSKVARTLQRAAARRIQSQEAGA